MVGILRLGRVAVRQTLEDILSTDEGLAPLGLPLPIVDKDKAQSIITDSDLIRVLGSRSLPRWDLFQASSRIGYGGLCVSSSPGVAENITPSDVTSGELAQVQQFLGEATRQTSAHLDFLV